LLFAVLEYEIVLEINQEEKSSILHRFDLELNQNQ